MEPMDGLAIGRLLVRSREEKVGWGQESGCL